jgi:hypothetical protein
MPQPVSTCSAAPAALLALAAAGPERAARLEAAAAALGAAGLPGAAIAVARHAQAGAALDQWTGGVGRAFAAADADGNGPRVLLRDEHGDGRLVTVFGDLATARHVAVLVPGVGTTLANASRTLERPAHSIFDTARGLDRDVAVVAWLGYDAPEVMTAAGNARAVRGGRALAAFVASLSLRAGATVSVVGHSYGSLVTAEALRVGMRVDGVVVAGSPGLGASTASELPLAGAALYALRAPFDPVGWSEAFGRDPSDPRFNATRLDTGDGADQPIGHSSYFEPGTRSLANTAAVVVGRTDLLDVIEPSAAELAQVVVDDVWRQVFDPPVDGLQSAAGLLSGAPGVGVVIDEGQHLVDELQRAASPDFVGDVLADAWDAFR